MKNYYQAMKEAGCQHMDYISRVVEEIVRAKEGWAYLGIVIYLEKKYLSGLLLRCKVIVEHDLVIKKKRPELYLCSQITDQIKAMDQEAGMVPLDLDQDWMKALEEAGCPYMSYIKAVKKEIISLPNDMYEAIVVYLEKEYSSGRTLGTKLEVDAELIKSCNDPAKFLCAELSITVKGMDKEADGSRT